MDREPKKIAVIGSGVAGLACARRLVELGNEQQKNWRVSLFDGASRPGGTIRTERRDGFLLEKGPDSFLSEKASILELCGRLGLESELIPTQKQARGAFVARKNRLVPLPEGFYLVSPSRVGSFLSTPLFSARGKARMLAEYFLPPQNMDRDESVAGFMRRRFGREALEIVGQPMIAGIHSGDPEKLGMLGTMPRFKELEKSYGSVIRGLRVQRKKAGALREAKGSRYSLFLSFREGMETLSRALAAGIPSDSWNLRTEIHDIRRESGVWKFTAGDGRCFEADAICCAASAKKSASLFQNFSPHLSDLLHTLAYESIAVLHLAYRRTDIAHAMSGFGFVVPSVESRSLTACTFACHKFIGRAPEGFALLRAFIGGFAGKKYWEMEDADLTRCVQADLNTLLGIRREPIFTALDRHAQAMPQYGVGHAAWLERVESELSNFPGLFLTGSAYRGTGIPDCAADGERQAMRIALMFK